MSPLEQIDGAASPTRSVGIIGGGAAGLTAAWELAQLGYQVELFEAGSELGGLASAFDWDDFRIERFYHFICQSDDTLVSIIERLGLSEKLHWVETKTGFYYEGQLYKFGSALDLLRFSPLSLFDKLRFGWNILYSRRFTRWGDIEDLPAKLWLIDQLGIRGYNVIWDPLLRVKFDEYHEKISAAWMWHRIHRVASSRRSPLTREKFGYVEGGSDTTIQTLAREAQKAGARIHMKTPCRALWIEGERCRGIQLGGDREGESLEFDRVICATPLPVYRKLIPPKETEYTRKLDSIRFIGVVCMILRLKHPISPNFWLNVHDDRIAFNGIIEYSRLYSIPDFNGSIVYVPFYLESTRERYSYPDEQLFEEYCEALKVINPQFQREWVEDYKVFRAPHAQPICHQKFSEVVPAFESPWDGAYLIESTQLYPADRIVSGTMRLAQDVVWRILDRDGRADEAPFRHRPANEIPC